jgi:hypothetical protein
MSVVGRTERGIDLIRDACLAHGSPPPVFRWDSGLWTELPFMAAETATDLTGDVPEARKSGKTPESRLESRLAGRLLLLLREAEMGKAKLAQALSHATVFGELHKQVRRLAAAEYIAMKILDKPSSPLQKYRLTREGVMLLETLSQETGSR